MIVGWEAAQGSVAVPSTIVRSMRISCGALEGSRSSTAECRLHDGIGAMTGFRWGCGCVRVWLKGWSVTRYFGRRSEAISGRSGRLSHSGMKRWRTCGHMFESAVRRGCRRRIFVMTVSSSGCGFIVVAGAVGRILSLMCCCSRSLGGRGSRARRGSRDGCGSRKRLRSADARTPTCVCAIGLGNNGGLRGRAGLMPRVLSCSRKRA